MYIYKTCKKKPKQFVFKSIYVFRKSVNDKKITKKYQ